MRSSEAITAANAQIQTGGGSYVGGNVNTQGGSFTGRDLVVHGDFHMHQPSRPIPLPRPPASLPILKDLVGRTTELAHYTQRLQQVGVAIITGMAGVGKTSFAQMIVQCYPDPQHVFCHTFFEGLGLRGLIERLGEFLAWHGQPTVWQLCHQGSQPLTDEFMLDYLLRDVAGGNYLLWLDDLHFVEQYAVARQFVKGLLAQADGDRLQLLITSRRTPTFMDATVVDILSGLKLADIEQLVAQRQLPLSTAQISALQHHTEGNAQLLILASSALKQTRQPNQLLMRLATTGEIERYLLEQIDNDLQPAEREVMIALAILLGYPAPRAAIESLLDSDDLRRILHALSEWMFVVVTHHDDERYYHQHSIVRDFYYASMNGAKRRLLHQRAATYFASVEELLTAAIHWLKAGEATTAANLLYDHLLHLLNQGQAQALYDLQAQFTRATLDDNTWTKVKFVAGRAATFVVDTTTALAAFAEAGQSNDPYLQAQALYYRAQLLSKVDLEEARCYYEQGVALLEPLVGAPPFADLLNDFYFRLFFFYLLEITDPEKAASYLAKAQALLTESDFSRQCDLHDALSILSNTRGDAQGEMHHLQTAYRAAMQAGANDLQIRAAHNLGQAYVWSGEHTTGLPYLQQAQTLANAIGHREWQANCDKTMGASYFFQADYAKALTHYQAAYAVFQQIGNQNALAWVCHDLAETYSIMGDFATARKYFTESRTLNDELDGQNITEALTNLAHQYPALLEMEQPS